MLKIIREFIEDIRNKVKILNEKGQGMVEYAIILAVVAAVAILVFGSGDETSGLGKTVNGAFTKANNKIDSVGSSSSSSASPSSDS